MTTDGSYLERLFRRLEETSQGDGRPQLAATIARVAQRVLAAPDPKIALGDLAAVREWHEFAVRLIWSLQERSSLGPEADEQELLMLQVGELRAACATSVKESRKELPPRSKSFDDVLLEFGKAAEGVKRGSFQNGQFVEIPRVQLDTVRRHAESLKRVATEEGNQDVQRFCTALILFVEYAVDRDLIRDVRVANLLDNANVTLQTVHQAVGAEEYDAIHQMIELLENPATLLE